jgi:catechol-2,3-dioxygenase
MTDFYTQVLGLHVSDTIRRDFVMFLNAGTVDHHIFGFISSTHRGFHHASFEVPSIDATAIGADRMRSRGRDSGWGLGRHTIGSNFFHYNPDPWGSWIEWFSDIDQIGDGWVAGDWERTRVAGLDARELDELYASRILLETLALSMTLADFKAVRQREVRRTLTAMRQAARSGDSAMWFQSHGEFHRIITAGAGNALQRQLTVFADRSTRYMRICQLAEPSSWHKAGDAEHAVILEALADGDRGAALSGLAHHLAGTAQRVLTECAPGYEINAVPRALELVAGGAANT